MSGAATNPRQTINVLTPLPPAGFHTAKSSHVLREPDALRLLTQLREAGVSKINFAGGEPFLPGYQPLLGSLVKHSHVLGFEAVSVITNGSMLHRKWFDTYGEYLTMLGVSCDSVEEGTNVAIGRVVAGSAAARGVPPSSSSSPSSSASSSGLDRASTVRRAAELCAAFKIDFKVNTVVCSANAHEDMSPLIASLLPSPLSRWKLFQVLPLGGENTGGEGELRDVRPLLITGEAFTAYVERARAGLRAASPPGLVVDPADIIRVEDNDTMQSSYLLIDEYGRLLTCSAGAKAPAGASILHVGVREAVRRLVASPGGGFDSDAFVRRDGQYYRDLLPA